MTECWKQYVFCCSEPLAYEAGGSAGEMPAQSQRESPSTPPPVPTPQRGSSANFLKSDGTLDYDGE